MQFGIDFFQQEIEVHLNQQRLEIEREMEGYHYEDLSGKNIIGFV